MQFNIIKRDGPARTGELIFNNHRVKTPNIFFIQTDRFKSPSFSDVIITSGNINTKKPVLKILEDFLLLEKQEKNKRNYDLISKDNDFFNEEIKESNSNLLIIKHAFQIFKKSKNFVNFIVKLRTKDTWGKALYLPSVGNPTILALLTYLGVDLFDCSSSIIAARNNYLQFPTGDLNINEIDEIPCSCPICNNINTKPSKMTFEQILNHNYFTMWNEIKQIRNAINNEQLREFVQTRIQTNPEQVAILRNLEQNHYQFLEEKTPIYRNSKLLATTGESLYRSEIIRFQKRLIERYKKPESPKILVLLPCSAKKPYSFSKTHKIFREQIQKTQNPSIIHEVILTSPIGVVPHELELVYPASNYDIPVTGVWTEDEKKMIRTLLGNYLKNNYYDHVIIHLPPKMTEFIKEIVKKPIVTCKDKTTSEESLNNLYQNLQDMTSSFKKINNKTRKWENVLSLAYYQFGRTIADKLLNKTQIVGKYPFLKIMNNDKQLGMITQPRGLISLTINGAKKIAESKNYCVEIYDDFHLKGSVFAPGIKNADEKIRIGDEVIVKRNKSLIAVGVALMNGWEMKNLTNGEAVKTRHII